MSHKNQEAAEFEELRDDALECVSGGLAEDGNPTDTDGHPTSSAFAAGGIVGLANDVQIDNCASRTSDASSGKKQ